MYIPSSNKSTRYVYSSAGLVVNNSAVLQDIPGLSIGVAANSWYAVQFFITYMADAAADLRLQITAPAGSGGQWIDYAGNARIAGTPMNIAGGGAAVELPWILTGYYNGGGAGGNLKLQAAQWVAQANNLTISVGSWASYIKLG